MSHLLDHEVGSGRREVGDASVSPSSCFSGVNLSVVASTSAGLADDEDRVAFCLSLREHELEVGGGDPLGLREERVQVVPPAVELEAAEGKPVALQV